jgi:hypothetical protein
VAHPSLDTLAAEYGVKDVPTIRAMTGALANLVGRAVNVYDY